MALARSIPGEHLQLQWLDAAFRLLRLYDQKVPSADIVVVGVDEATIEASGKPFALMLDDFALALDGMRLGQAHAVGVDLIFPSASFERLIPGAAQRLALAIGRLRAQAPLVLGHLGAGQSKGDAAPLYSAMAGTAGEGLLLVKADRDGSLRRIDGDHAGLLLASRLAQQLGQRPAAGIVDFSIGPRFDYLPMHAITTLVKTGKTAGLRRHFAGKVVVLGVVLPDQDRQRLPVTLAAWEQGATGAGVLFQAQALRSLLGSAMIPSLPWVADAAALLAAMLLWRQRPRAGRAAVAAVALTATWLIVSLALLAAGVEAPLAAPLLALGLGLAFIAAQAYLHELTEQRRIRAIFAGYVSPAILDTILSGALQNGLASQRRPLAFLFADIRGFTAFCAVTPPEQVIAFLNRYYTAITCALHQHGGTIDKFSGDGIMVFFGAPQPSANPARDAVLAALAMLEALARLNAELANEGAQVVKVGIGVAYGDAVLGNVGSDLRHDYTATGAVTALAAHIQQHCKQVPHTLLVEQATLERAQLPPMQHACFHSMEVALEKHGRVRLAGYLEKETHHA